MSPTGVPYSTVCPEAGETLNNFINRIMCSLFKAEDFSLQFPSVFINIVTPNIVSSTLIYPFPAKNNSSC